MFLLVTHGGALWMEMGLLHDYFGNISQEVKSIIPAWKGSMQGEILYT